MTSLIEVGRIEEIDAQGTAVVAVPHSRVALFHLASGIHAIDDACVRCAASLAQGKLAGTLVTCPSCGWTYDIVTGCVNGIEALCTAVYSVSVRDGHVFLALPVDVSSSGA